LVEAAAEERQVTDTPAHDQHQTIQLLRHYPEHEPRKGDPNYAEFEHVRGRLKAQGLLRCAVGNEDCAGQMQLHHSSVEFAYINAIDVVALDVVLGLDLTDATFVQWVESPGNLEPLCQAHHVGILGVHCIPTADWDVVRAHKAGVLPVEAQQSAVGMTAASKETQ
jgi:hypothetical protein